MKAALTFILLIGLGTLSCKPKDPALKPKDDTELLHQRFHGKYKIISSISNEAVDVNLDGTKSSNLLEEIADLNFQDRKQFAIEIRIYGPSKEHLQSGLLFTQAWPEQYLQTSQGSWNGGELLSYDPAYSVSYVMQGTVRTFTFSDDLRQIIVNPNENDPSLRWVRPESVHVQADGRLQVVNKRRLYTREGVKAVTITTLYERFTMTT
jgi:hypothetical protein